LKNLLFQSSLLFTIAAYGLQLHAQHKEPTPEVYLQNFPLPALTVEEALARTPVGTDTLMVNRLKELSTRADKDTAGSEAAVNKQRGIHVKLLGRLRQKLESDIRAIGETVDDEIRACPKGNNAQGQAVYDSTCVAQAEHRGYKRRVAVVEDYLSNIHQVWPQYIAEAQRIVGEARRGKWQVVLRVAIDVAIVTELAGQFTR
jgi:hypothetical protein